MKLSAHDQKLGDSVQATLSARSERPNSRRRVPSIPGAASGIDVARDDVTGGPDAAAGADLAPVDDDGRMAAAHELDGSGQADDAAADDDDGVGVGVGRSPGFERTSWSRVAHGDPAEGRRRRMGPARLPTMASHVFDGVMPALMTPCRSDGAPDVDALVASALRLTLRGDGRRGVLRLDGGLATALGRGAPARCRCPGRRRAPGDRRYRSRQPGVCHQSCPARRSSRRRRAHGDPAGAVAWQFGCRATSALPSRAGSGRRAAVGDLQLPVLRIHDRCGAVFRSPVLVLEPRRVQGVRRR